MAHQIIINISSICLSFIRVRPKLSKRNLTFNLLDPNQIRLTLRYTNIDYPTTPNRLNDRHTESVVLHVGFTCESGAFLRMWGLHGEDEAGRPRCGVYIEGEAYGRAFPNRLHLPTTACKPSLPTGTTGTEGLRDGGL